MFWKLKELQRCADPEVVAGGLAELNLDADLRSLVELAFRISKWPQRTTRQTAARLARQVRSAEKYLDGACVIAGFSFINRLTDALGTPTELPAWLLRSRLGHPIAIRMWQSALKRRLRYQPEEIAVDVDRQLQDLRDAFGELGFSSLPESFRALALAPPFLTALAELMAAVAATTSGDAALRRAMNRRAHATSRRVGASEVAAQLEDWLACQPPCEEPATARESALDDFAAAVDLRATGIDAPQIDEVRRSGVGDEQILDLAFGVSLWNAVAMLEPLIGARWQELAVLSASET